MAFTYRALRSHITQRRPAGGLYRYGEIYVNTADEQIGVISEQLLPLDFIAVRFFRNTAEYKDGDYIVHDGHLYRAKMPIPPGNFDPSLWERSGADLSLIDYDPDIGYQKGDYVFINGIVYEALQDIPAPAGPFDESLWQSGSFAGGGSGHAVGDVISTFHEMAFDEQQEKRRVPLLGQAIKRSGEYAELFAAWGTQFGNGDGFSTFNVPDTRGYVLRGVDTAETVDVDASRRFAVNNGGNTGAVGGTYQNDLFKEHAHLRHSAIGTATDHSNQVIKCSDPWPSPGQFPGSVEGGAETRMKNIAVYWYAQY